MSLPAPDEINIRETVGFGQANGFAPRYLPPQPPNAVSYGMPGGPSPPFGGPTAINIREMDTFRDAQLFGFGDSAALDSCNCANVDPWDLGCVGYCAMMGGDHSNDPSWFDTAFKWVVKNSPTLLPLTCRVAGISCPAFFPGTQIPLIPPPWYTTTGGMIGLGVVFLGVGYVGYKAMKK